MNSELLRTNDSVIEVMDKYADMVLRVSLLYLKNKTDAEDVFQNVFLKLCESRLPMDDDEHIKAWLITVARNECKNLLRSFWRKNTTCIDEVVIPIKDPEDQGVIKALLSLPFKYREILYLFYFEDYKIHELSKMFGIKEATVKTRLRRGRDLLKELLLQGGFQDG